MSLIDTLKRLVLIAPLALIFSAQGAFALDADQSKCMEEFQNVRAAYNRDSHKMTIISSDANGINPFHLIHAFINNKSYSLWESLNGEVRGYAVRDGEGFDYNQDRSLLGPLSWHPTVQWDKLFSTDEDMSDFSCVITGRGRLINRKVAFLRLMPQDSLRYSYVIAKDEDTSLPIELSLVEPGGTTVLKNTLLEATTMPDEQGFPVDDGTFDRYLEGFKAHQQAFSYSAPWKELSLPAAYRLIDSGIFTEGGDNCLYQDFSDGLTGFRVYRNSRSSMYFPMVNTGSLVVYRKQSSGYEYIVAGEIPLRLAQYILSKI